MKLLEWPEGASPARAQREAWLNCPHCHTKIRDEGDSANGVKHWMNQRGVMIARGQWLEDGPDGGKIVVGEPIDTNVLSFWVSGLASPFVSWGDRAEALLTAQESGDPGDIQTATNAGFGELYAAGGGEVPEWKQVLGLTRTYATGTLPDGVILLTAGIDVQKNRLVFVIRGWGARATSWKIVSGELWGPTHEPEVWEALDDLLSQRWGGLPVKVAFIDSGFRPGKPDAIPENMVYEFCRKHARFVFATKGHDTQTVPIRRTKIEVIPTGGANKYGLELMHLDSDYFKRWVHERVRWPVEQPGAWFLNQGEDTNEAYARQIVSEARTLSPTFKPVWVRRSRDNNYLDCEALCAAAGYFINVQRIGVIPKRSGSSAAPAEAVAAAA
jgi:phage terminase large subunit GpA-like protein